MRKAPVVLGSFVIGIACLVAVFLVIPRWRSVRLPTPQSFRSTPPVTGNPQHALQDSSRAASDNAMGQDVYISLARVDGLGAITKAKLELSPEDFQALVPHLLQIWADSDPLLAIRWLGGQRRDSDISEAAYNVLIATAFKKLGGTNPTAALTALSLLPPNDHKTALKWASHGATTGGKGTEFIEAVRYLDVGTRTAAEAFALESWVRLNPSEAVTAFQAVIPAADRNEPIRAQLGEAWMAVDPRAASSWWLYATPDAERRSAIEEIVNIWADADPRAAAEWLNSIDSRSPEEKDPGIRALAYAVAEQDAPAALVWARTIRNDFLREETLSALINAAPEENSIPR